jgi:predicted Zn finger-like uncharacterized protein
MIITCPNCNKQFKIDNSLIPEEGRDLQCGSCNHIWFYNIQEKNNEVLELKQEIVSGDIDTKTENKEDKIEEKQQAEEIIKSEINNKKKENNSVNQKNTTTHKKEENKGSKFFSYLIVFIISFAALIILLDTLKTPLIKVFPELEIILFNLFETLQDIKLFIIDLI